MVHALTAMLSVVVSSFDRLGFIPAYVAMFFSQNIDLNGKCAVWYDEKMHICSDDFSGIF